MTRIIKRTRRPRKIVKTIKVDLTANEIVFLRGLAILCDLKKESVPPDSVRGVDAKAAARKLLQRGLLESYDGGATVCIPPSLVREINRWRVS